MSSGNDGAAPGGYGAPILLIGMPRSGTTWLGKLFDSSPDTLYLHEPDSVELLRDVPLAPRRADYPQYGPTVRAYLQRMLTLRGDRVTGKLPLFRKRYQRGYQRRAREALIAANKLGGRFGKTVAVPDLISGARRATVRPVWKSIEATARAALFAEQLGGHVVVLLRHPCGQISSTLRGESRRQFVSSTPSADDYGSFERLLDVADELGVELTLEQLKTMTPAQRLAWRWRLTNDKTLSEADRAGLLVLRYEDLCRDPQAEVERLFAACELTMTDQTTTFIAASTGHSDERYYSVFKDPLTASQQWRQELSAEQISDIRTVVGDGPAGKLFAGDF